MCYDRISTADNSTELTWTEQNRQGRVLADALLARMVADQSPLLLSSVFRELHNSVERDGQRAGFVHRIAEKLMGVKHKPSDVAEGAAILQDTLQRIARRKPS